MTSSKNINPIEALSKAIVELERGIYFTKMPIVPKISMDVMILIFAEAIVECSIVCSSDSEKFTVTEIRLGSGWLWRSIR